jgi:aminopeptidase N
VRKNEPWIRDALGFLHHPLHGSGSEKYVGESLEILPKIKQTGGIFFPLDWLYGTLGYHVSQNTRKIVENYLKTHPDLEKGLRLKILQAADPLMRLTKP